MSTWWRLLGELPQARTREEIRIQKLGDWYPWQQPWNPSQQPPIAIRDLSDPAEAHHVRIMSTIRNGSSFIFACAHLDSGLRRIYVPATPNVAGAIQAAQCRYDGFWRSTKDDNEELPWPEPFVDWIERSAFLRKLVQVEARARRVAYRGYSPCRICGRRNGNSSLQFAEWEWPEGFRHYIEDHLVRPSSDFEEFARTRATNASK